MKILIVGLGSIARKHIEAMKQLKLDTDLMALRSERKIDETGIKNIYNWDEVPNIDFIIISNPTSSHYKTIERALDYRVPLFIEKPSLMNLDGASILVDRIKKESILTYVAFNMRYLSALIWLREYLTGKRIIEVLVYCGSYLPDWRPNIDYRTSYSASKENGGGVHLDLIHEIDYVYWLFGRPERVISMRNKLSDLQINSTDSAIYQLHYQNKIAVIILNYFRKDRKRTIDIVFDDHSISVDLIKNVVTNSDGDVLFHSEDDFFQTYIRQMEYFVECINSNIQPENSFEDSLTPLKICLNDES